MDMIVAETLRKWPVGLALDRLCVKPYILEEKNGRTIKINPGETISIPMYGIHRDNDIYPEPDKFIPERFDDDNSKNSSQNINYFPFGLGPRNCIGSRFALMECKAILYHMLSNFTFEISDKTQIPLKIKTGMVLLPEKGINIHLKPRLDVKTN